MKEAVENKEGTLVKDGTIEWALATQTLLIALFIFLLYIKGQNTEHLHTILTGSIFVYDFKRYQKNKSKRSLVGLIIWGLIFAFSLITTLQLIGSL